MKQIEIIISPDGSSRIETRGFSGRSCLNATGQLEEALGQRLTETKTAEFYQQTQNQTEREERQ